MTKRLKLTLMLCCISLSSITLAKKVNPLIKCLGLEELAIHKKKVFGPVYKLNQHFINELSTLYGLTLKEDSLKRVCRQKSFSPSVNLLQELLIKGKSAFIIPQTSSEDGVTALATSSLEGFLDKTPHVFFTYLSQLQALAPMAPCLENKIPEIGYFMERYKYLEDISGSRGIIEKEQSKVLSIFYKLKKFDSIIKVCTKEKEKLKAKK
ncbi:MAG: hypothetical protein NXH75_17630 [Halobacteriovoraceae bacterium]|nr:hypothetical protein [Halobacteriovoraceae bacterium]